MVDELIVVIAFKDELVIHIVLSEELDAHSRRNHDKHYTEGKDEYLNIREELLPMIFTVFRFSNAEVK